MKSYKKINKTFISVTWNNCCFLNFQSNLTFIINYKFKHRLLISRRFYRPNSYFLRVLKNKNLLEDNFKKFWLILWCTTVFESLGYWLFLYSKTVGSFYLQSFRRFYYTRITGNYWLISFVNYAFEQKNSSNFNN